MEPISRGSRGTRVPCVAPPGTVAGDQVHIGIRVKARPQLEKALALDHPFNEAAPKTPAIFAVHEPTRLTGTRLTS